MRIIPIILFLICLNSYSQQKKINAGLLSGVKGCSINGRGMLKSFNYLGFINGAFTNMELDRDLSIQFEITYLKKGSRPNFEYFDNRGWINLNYIEIPVLIKSRTKSKDVALETGIAWARLLSFEQKYIIPKKVNDPFKKTDISFLMGISRKLHLSYFDIPVWINFRYSFSIVRISEYSYNLPPCNSLLNFAKRGQYNRVFYITLRHEFGVRR